MRAGPDAWPWIRPSSLRAAISPICLARRDDGGERRRGQGADFKAVEAGDRHPRRHHDALALRPQQGADGEVVIGEEQGIELRRGLERRHQRVPADLRAGFLVMLERWPPGQPCRRQRLVQAPVALCRAIVLLQPATDEADLPVAPLDQVLPHRLTGADVRQADIHVDRPGAQFHDLDQRPAIATQQGPRALGVPHAGDDQSGRRPAEQGGDQLAFAVQVVLGIAEQRLVAGLLQHLLDALDHLDEHRVGQRRHDHRDDPARCRGQRAGILVAHVAERAHRLFDLGPQRGGDAVRRVERTRNRDRCDARALGDILQRHGAAMRTAANRHSRRCHCSRSIDGGPQRANKPGPWWYEFVGCATMAAPLRSVPSNVAPSGGSDCPS